MTHQDWVSRHDPVITRFSPESPLTVGNGSFAYTADISGMQTLYRESLGETPLCTMADWGWHSIPAPVPGGRYTLSDIRKDRFSFQGREVTYARTRFPGSEAAYDWLRENPHKANLARIGLLIHGEAPDSKDFSDIRQTLHLYSGVLESYYLLKGTPCRVLTACDPEKDLLAFRIDSDLLQKGMTVGIEFPCGSPDISGSDWTSAQHHNTKQEGSTIHRTMDDLSYNIRENAPDAVIEQTDPHRIRITAGKNTLCLTLSFSRTGEPETKGADEVFDRCGKWWNRFWEQGGMLDLSGSSDPRAVELERRIVLSLYLLAVNSAGRMPPAETGLTCNSWYGKAHLEMHFWHMAWAPLWGHGELLERSLPWYHAHLPEARANAARNGYKGARWPKMIAEDAQDSPSPIAVLLVWQQPHPLILLDLILRGKDREQAAPFLRAHWPIVQETADFMADYAVRDAQGVCHIVPPVIPVQERYEPEETLDPSFECAYWKFGLETAIRWAEQTGMPVPEKWREVAGHMAPPPMADGLYIAHANAPETFSKSTDDHPSMLQCLGLLPGEGIDREAMTRTLHAVMEKWDYNSLWGWDFAVLAMTALRLGEKETAIHQLLMDTPKNTYVTSGNNRQAERKDLPLYLPGNGSLLLACAMMAAGWDGCGEETPGFPREKGWRAAWEGIRRWY